MKTLTERREEIATAIYPKCIETVEQILWRGKSCGEDTPQKAAAKMAVRYASELIYQLREYEQTPCNERKDF